MMSVKCCQVLCRPNFCSLTLRIMLILSLEWAVILVRKQVAKRLMSFLGAVLHLCHFVVLELFKLLLCLSEGIFCSSKPSTAVLLTLVIQSN